MTDVKRVPYKNIIWMEVTRDEYELPVAVADTADKLGKLVGVKGHSIMEIMFRAKKRGGKCKYITVNISEEDNKDGD